MKLLVLLVLLILLALIISYNTNIEGFNSSSIDKSLIFNIIKKEHSLKKALELFPDSFSLHDPDDLIRLDHHYKPENLYKLTNKNNSKIVDSLDKILLGRNNGYTFAQQMRHDQYLVYGKEVRLKFYIKIHESNYTIINDIINYKQRYPPKINNSWSSRDLPKTIDSFVHYLDKQNRPFTDHEMWHRSPYSFLSDIVLKRLRESTDLVIPIMKSLKNNHDIFYIEFGLNHKLEPCIKSLGNA
jgi:hypothetical protein